MKRYICLMLYMALVAPIFGQSEAIDRVVQEIISNNTELKAQKYDAKAQEREYSVAATLPNLDIEYAHLWGKPFAIGNRDDFSISQEFDMATILGTKKDNYSIKKQLINSELELQQRDLMLYARECCIELIYFNAQIELLKKREENAKLILQIEEQRLSSGEGNKIDENNARATLIARQSELKNAELECETLLSTLKLLNGGKEISLDISTFPILSLPAEFQKWYSQIENAIIELSISKNVTEQSQKELALSKINMLPSLSAGYMSEKVVGEHFQGITMGLSIPLWSARNNVKKATDTYQSSVTNQEYIAQSVYAKLHSLYLRALKQKENIQFLQEALESTNNSELILKALQLGEIALLEYMASEALYYDLKNQILLAEREYLKAATALLFTPSTL